jgi:wyosine [tRNA(Phe)-imidazoG37] synthetase (radical SAM superfamily)
MAGFLFHDLIFGPVRSRRLGLSLGINLLPTHKKFCSFNCIYCECGWTLPVETELRELPSRGLVHEFLEKRLKELVAEDYLPDVLTYAGNGEPTLHPEFPEIVDDTIALRDKYVPGANVSVLSNASMLGNPKVSAALRKIDNNILKLDAGTEKMFRLINNPGPLFDFDRLIANLKEFNGKLIIQTMFLRGEFNGETVDNTTENEVNAWVGRLVEIRPSLVMIYPISRETPLQNLQKIGSEELEAIAEKVRTAGIEVKVYS